MSTEQGKPILPIEIEHSSDGGVLINQGVGGSKKILGKYPSLTNAYDELRHSKAFENCLKWGHVFGTSVLVYAGANSVSQFLKTEDPFVKMVNTAFATVCAVVAYKNIKGIGEQKRKVTFINAELDELRDFINKSRE